MLRLNAFAKQVGISTVYASYIENGKRPAPSEKILNKISSVLTLDDETDSYMRYLASLSRDKFSIPDNVLKYLSERPYAYKSLLLAAENQLDENAWNRIETIILQKIDHPK